MWFGDYVTMKWWDGLWLNESFATMMAYLMMNYIKEKLDFEAVDGISLMLVRKQRGYKEDKRSTTHPIHGEVISTSKADSIFDGITYAKGCSVLMQLYHLIGH